jgi:hypothetical protein
MKMARDAAKKLNLELYENIPNLEAFFFDILEDKRKFQHSSIYKSEFEKGYINEDNRDDLKEYSKVFPKDLLERRRKEMPVLNALIKIFEGK